MRNKFWWEAGLSAEAAVYGCNIQSNHNVFCQICVVLGVPKLYSRENNNLEIEAELHVVSEQLLWWSLVPVDILSFQYCLKFQPKNWPACPGVCSGDDSMRVLPGRFRSSKLGCAAEQDPREAQANSSADCEAWQHGRVTLWKGIPLIAPLTPALQTQVGTSTPDSWILPPVL